MHVIVNGQSREVDAGTTVEQLVRAGGLSVEKVAVEHNRRLLRSEKYSTELQEADEVEIVTFVGGG